MISLRFVLFNLFLSVELNIKVINKSYAFLKPSSITSFLLKFISKGLEISISLISKDFASILSVEKKIYLEIEIKKKYIRI